MYKNTVHTEEEILHLIALQGVTGLGPVALRALVDHFDSATEIFRQSPRTLEMINGIGELLRDAVEDPETMRRAQKEMDFIDRMHIDLVTLDDENYPYRLKECGDAPYILFTKGEGNLNPEKCVSIVGTRKATKYGRTTTDRIVNELAAYGVTVISGLAYGIDSCAHRSALANGLETFAVLAHGMDRVYPKQNNRLAYDMLQQGGLLTELMKGVPPDRDQFPRRNRIVAGLSDAVIVVESSKKGGSLISAKLGRHYDREVFAVPGRVDDAQSVGCLSLIAQHLALPFVSADQFAVELGWHKSGSVADVLTGDESIVSGRSGNHRPKEKKIPEVENKLQPLVNMLSKQEQIHVDDLAANMSMAPAELSVQLFDLEVRGIVRSLPGKMITLDT